MNLPDELIVLILSFVGYRVQTYKLINKQFLRCCEYHIQQLKKVLYSYCINPDLYEQPTMCLVFPPDEPNMNNFANLWRAWQCSGENRNDILFEQRIYSLEAIDEGCTTITCQDVRCINVIPNTFVCIASIPFLQGIFIPDSVERVIIRLRDTKSTKRTITLPIDKTNKVILGRGRYLHFSPPLYTYYTPNARLLFTLEPLNEKIDFIVGIYREHYIYKHKTGNNPSLWISHIEDKFIYLNHLLLPLQVLTILITKGVCEKSKVKSNHKFNMMECKGKYVFYWCGEKIHEIEKNFQSDDKYTGFIRYPNVLTCERTPIEK